MDQPESLQQDPTGVLQWTAPDRTSWRIELAHDAIVLSSGDESYSIPDHLWPRDLYVAPHGDGYIVRFETEVRSIGFVVTAAQAEPLLNHIQRRSPAAVVTPVEVQEPPQKSRDALLWPKVSPIAVWALITSSLAFLPIVGALPATASAVLLIVHRIYVRRSAAYRHSRALCLTAFVLTTCGLAVSMLGTWSMFDTVDASETDAPDDWDGDFMSPMREHSYETGMREGNSVTQVPRTMCAAYLGGRASRRAMAQQELRPPLDSAGLINGGTPIIDPASLSNHPESNATARAKGTRILGSIVDQEHNWGLIVAALFAVIFSLSVHEAAHAISAWWLGDDLARGLGRVTLNPLSHIDPIGTVVLPLILFLSGLGVFGWARPVPVRLENVPRQGRAQILVAIAGPGSNLLIAAVSMMLLIAIGSIVRLFIPGGTLAGLSDLDFESTVTASGFALAPVVGPMCTILQLSFVTNVFLAFFNLIPIPPLDGSWVLQYAFPRTLGPIYYRMRPYSFLLFLGLIYSDLLMYLLIPAVFFIMLGLGLLHACTGF